MSDKIYTIEQIKMIVSPIAQKHNIPKVYLFGSYARGEADSESDIDIRIDAENLHSLFDLGKLYGELEEAFGKSLDLVTTEALRSNLSDPLTRRFVRNMKRDECLIYEK